MTESLPIVLTIAGSDSGGGAGVQADLKTFSSLGAFGTTVFTCLTAQNPDGVSAIHTVSLDFIKQQLDAVFQYFPVLACKTGMLFSEEIISLVSEYMRSKPVKLVVDPVMVATSGAKLLQDDAILALKEKCIPLASLITPNLDEAKLLLGKDIPSSSALESAAKELYEIYKVPILLKGGHLKDSKSAIDVLFDGKAIYSYQKPFLDLVNTHGTGCTYSSAITTFLAKGDSLPEAVGNAKEYLHRALETSVTTGKTKHLFHFAKD
ncbi:bifunctional hydroxymethylpyrimidine kinase/phosphomethylpyrimidine kinase [Leptospira ryugenii]|nr:bifunctional hydroxymethylpyrimidine kinase/phosphomethylpyrimidine kinase [Leptospira ryugenii]